MEKNVHNANRFRTMSAVRLILLLLFVSVACSDALATKIVIPGKVVGVHDGDTITVLTPTKTEVRVRLHGIDTPEIKQAFGSRAKQELSSLVFGKEVRVQVIEKDRYGRTVGRVLVGTMNVNVEMVRPGFAWWYVGYAKKDAELAKAEVEARGDKRGLWADKAPIPPWEFRRAGKKAPADNGAR